MKPIDASAPTHADIVKPSPVLPDTHNFTRVIGDVNPRTKLVAETLPSQPTKEELLTSTIDKTLGASTEDGPTLVTVCADVQNYDNMNDSDDERLIIDELCDTASIDSEEAVTRMHVFRETLSNFFPVQDLVPPPPTPSISLTSPSTSIPSSFRNFTNQCYDRQLDHRREMFSPSSASTTTYSYNFETTTNSQRKLSALRVNLTDNKVTPFAI